MWLFVPVWSLRRWSYFHFKKCFICHGNCCYDRLFFQLFGIKIKHFQMWIPRYWSTERGSCGSLWFKICWFGIRYCQNIEVQFAYNKKIQNEKNFYKVILDTQNILNLWWMRSLTIEGKITIFKTLTLSKVVYLTLLAVVPNHIIDELIKVQTNFI